MRKVLPLLIVIIILGGIGYYYWTNMDLDSTKDAQWMTEKRFLEISLSPSELVNFIADVKENPQSVMNTYTLLRKMIYSGDYDASNRESLLMMQRSLLVEQLLEKNPKEMHILQMEAELEKWQENKFRIIGSDSLPPDYYPLSIFEDMVNPPTDIQEAVIIKVVYYTNDIETEEHQDTDIYTEYILVQNKMGLWEIYGWNRIEPFEIVK